MEETKNELQAYDPSEIYKLIYLTIQSEDSNVNNPTTSDGGLLHQQPQ